MISTAPTYTVTLTPAADRTLRNLDSAARRQVADLLGRLTGNPRPPGVRAMTGLPRHLRARTGDYRVVYRVGAALTIEVITVGTRRDVYRH